MGEDRLRPWMNCQFIAGPHMSNCEFGTLLNVLLGWEPTLTIRNVPRILTSEFNKEHRDKFYPVEP